MPEVGVRLQTSYQERCEAHQGVQFYGLTKPLVNFMEKRERKDEQFYSARDVKYRNRSTAQETGGPR